MTKIAGISMVAAGLVAQALWPAELPADDRPLLVLALDGISLDAAKEVWEEGAFPGFHPPSGNIAPFPSLTDVSMSGMFHAGPVPGYEEIYYDTTRHALAGTTWSYLRATKFERSRQSYYGLLHYADSRFWEIPNNLFPKLLLGFDLWRFFRSDAIERFAANPAAFHSPLSPGSRIIVTYLESGDVVAHQTGHEGAVAYLRVLAEFLEVMRKKAGEPFDALIFSDHGNAEGISRFCPVTRFLRERGYRVEDRVSGRRSVVVPTFGLISSVALHAAREESEELAAAIAGLSCVDMVFSGEKGMYTVRHGGQLARIEHDRSSDSYAYRPEEGDPLGYRSVMKNMGDSGYLDSNGFASSRRWFDATADSAYPNALERTAEAFESLVQNPATILLSLKPGTFYGRSDIRFWTRLESTHGGMAREESLGFVMTTLRPLPPFVRYKDFLGSLLGGATE
ncbi:MAG: hypothetical protein HYT87_03350 [Nitrospirae bacterium]|nr:hypothetical protein [Nitrospirota bacterium]